MPFTPVEKVRKTSSRVGPPRKVQRRVRSAALIGVPASSTASAPTVPRRAPPRRGSARSRARRRAPCPSRPSPCRKRGPSAGDRLGRLRRDRRSRRENVFRYCTTSSTSASLSDGPAGIEVYGIPSRITRFRSSSVGSAPVGVVRSLNLPVVKSRGRGSRCGAPRAPGRRPSRRGTARSACRRAFLPGARPGRAAGPCGGEREQRAPGARPRRSAGAHQCVPSPRGARPEAGVARRGRGSTSQISSSVRNFSQAGIAESHGPALVGQARAALGDAPEQERLLEHAAMCAGVGEVGRDRVQAVREHAVAAPSRRRGSRSSSRSRPAGRSRRGRGSASGSLCLERAERVVAALKVDRLVVHGDRCRAAPGGPVRPKAGRLERARSAARRRSRPRARASSSTTAHEQRPLARLGDQRARAGAGTPRRRSRLEVT